MLTFSGVHSFSPSFPTTPNVKKMTSFTTSQIGYRNTNPDFVRIRAQAKPIRSKIVLNNNLANESGEIDYTKVKPKLYSQRWIQLGYLSMLALLSDWICFSVAAAPSTYETAYAGHSAAQLIDIFLFTNVASCFLVTDTVGRFGLEKAIKGAAALMATGCLLRSGFGFLTPILTSLGITTGVAAASGGDALAAAGLVPYWSLIAGTVMVGAAQPFFQCTPPMLSATWFGSNERATSTAIALNFNQIGIATAFLVGGGMATSDTGLASYFSLITLSCAVVTAGTFLQFQNEPAIPPSSSELEKRIKGEQEPPFIESVKKFFATPGFSRPLAAFIMSISITNIVGAFIDEVMERGGITSQLNIDLAGAGFEFGILFGGIIIGGYVDKTKKYKSVTMACIVASILLLIPLGLTEHAIGQEPVLLVLALLGLGMSAGPIQPINAELAVDVTYPSDETAVESVQQIGGNLMSALLVPLIEISARQDYQLLPNNPTLASDVRGDVVLLCAIAAITLAYFKDFDAPLLRTLADESGDDSDSDKTNAKEKEGVVIDTEATTVSMKKDKVFSSR
jgi:MFS family permease